jgi:hypothetical protein
VGKPKSSPALGCLTIAIMAPLLLLIPWVLAFYIILGEWNALVERVKRCRERE